MSETRMDLSEIMEALIENECVVFDEFEDALIGVTCGWGETRAVYEYGKVIECLVIQNDWDWDTALEHFERNTAGSFLGPTTPEIVDTGYEPEIPPDGCLSVSHDELVE